MGNTGKNIKYKKWSQRYEVGTPEGEERENGNNLYFKLMTENFPKLL